MCSARFLSTSIFFLWRAIAENNTIQNIYKMTLSLKYFLQENAFSKIRKYYFSKEKKIIFWKTVKFIKSNICRFGLFYRICRLLKLYKIKQTKATFGTLCIGMSSGSNTICYLASNHIQLDFVPLTGIFRGLLNI